MNPVSLCYPLAPLKLLVTELVWRQISQSSSAGRWLTGSFTLATTCHHSAKQSTWRAWCQEDKATLPNGQLFLGWDNFWAMDMHPGDTLFFSDCSFHCVPTHNSQPPEMTFNFTVFLSSETHIGREGECLFPRFFFFFFSVLHSAATE